MTQSLSKIKFVVGLITEVSLHPNANKLFVEKIDTGDKIRTIVSGLRDYYSAEQLLGKKIIVVANLKPANLRGIVSEGMILAVEDDQKHVGLVLAPDEVDVGAILQCGKLDGDPASEITIDEFFSVSMRADASGVYAQDHVMHVGGLGLRTDKGIMGKVR